MSMGTLSEDAAACEYIIALVYERCRIRLHRGKEALIKARLGKLMRQRGFSGLAQYCDFLQRCADEAEFTRVVDALTTNFTQFLREPDHFQFLVQQALPSLLGPGQKKFQVWSAACSSGEEPFSLGFYLAEHFSPALGWDWRILASDISTKVLEQAQQGVYPAERLETVPPEWRRKYFQQGLRQWSGFYRVKPALAARVTFQHLNLVQNYTHARPFEIIFCRNVMIYFDRPTQEQLVQRLCHFLVPGGYLFVGHSESLNGMKVPLRCLRPSLYQKS